jgi:putative ABC transport system permease protein
MMGWDVLKSRVRSLFHRSVNDRELEEELRFHLEKETELGQKSGLSPVEARRQALLAFGGYDRIVEETRDARGTASIENMLRDLRFAARGLRRDSRFAVVAVLTLAIGVGATTAVFSLANSFLLRPVIGVHAPDELVVVQLTDESGTIAGLAHANISDLRAATPALAGLAGYASQTLQTRTETAGALEVEATIVDGDYFGVLGLTPRMGRWFTAEELAPEAAGDVVVISDRFRGTYFGRAPDVLGRSVQLNAENYTVVGVAPAGFHGTMRTGDDDVWIPAAAYGRMWHRQVQAADRRASIFVELVGRLAPGNAPAVAEQQLHTVMTRLLEAYPDVNGYYAGYQLHVYEGIGLAVSARERTRRTLELLLGSVFVLLLIACLNFANLLLFRGVARQGETAVRAALGASVGRLVQQHVTEGLLLSIVGGVLGIIMALAIGVMFQGQQFPGLAPIGSIAIDRRVIAFALCSAVLTGVVFAVLPAAMSLRNTLTRTMRSFGRSVTDAGSAVRAALVVLQVAASLTLVIGAIMLMRTVRNLDAVDVGFDADHVFTFGVSPAPQGYDSNEARAFRERILREVSALPGVTTAAVTSFAPFGRDRMMFRLTVPGSGLVAVPAVTNEVSAAYFETVGTPVIAGHGFNESEQNARLDEHPGIVLSNAVAHSLFGEAAGAVGRLVEVAGFTGTTLQSVVGVAEDVRGSPRSGPQPAAYMPIGTASLPQTYALIRTDMSLEQAKQVVGEAIARIDPNVPFFTAESLTAAIRRAAAEERLLARLLGTFGLLAVLLAAVGLHGIISYSVARRRREIGIRMAIGARPDTVVRLVVSRSMKLVFGGCALGVVGGYVLSTILANRMFGVTPVDAAAYVIAFATFGVVALAGSAPSAVAAVRVDPLETLRQE